MSFARFGDEVERPRWAELLGYGVAIFDIDYDAILAAMYALSVTAEGDCYLCVPSDPSIEAASLGASESALPGTVPAEALHTFTLDSGASRCFFRDNITLTPLPALVSVRLADPSGGPVLACSSTVLPCPTLNLLPHVFFPETSPTLRWTGKVGDASVLRVWGSRAFVRDTSADKLSARAIPCAFLGFPPDTPGWQFYHPTSRRVLPSQDAMFDESVPFYHLFPYRTAPLPSPPPAALPCSRSPSDSGAASWGAASGGAASGGAEPASEEPGGAELKGVESGDAEPGGAEAGGTEPEGAEPGVQSLRVRSLGVLSLGELRLPEVLQRTRLRSGAAGAGGSPAGGTGARGAGAISPRAARPRGPGAAGAGGFGDSGVGDPGAGGTGAGGAGAGGIGAGGAGASSLGGAGVTAGARGTGGAGAAGPRGARTRGTGAAEAGGVGGIGARDIGVGGAGSGGTGAGDTCAGGAGAGGAGAGGAGAGGTGAGDPGAGGTGPGGAGAGGTGAGGTVQPLLQPDSPLPAPSPYDDSLPPPPASSLPAVPDPESDLARAANPAVPCLLATVVTDPSLESTAASALVAELVEFSAACHLDYATSLVAESESKCPPSVWDECALGMDVLEDRHEDFECLAAAVPHLVAMLLAPEGDPDAPDILTPCSYAEANTVPPFGANIVDGMKIFRVKRPPGSPPVFKARYVARGFSQRQGVDFFHTFSPTPKITTLRVLLHVAAQRDYELHSLDFSTSFLQYSLHEEIWPHRPPGFTGSFPAGTQWSLRRPVYGLRQAPREWHDTLRTLLTALGFAPLTADPSLFLRTDTSLPSFYVLVLQRFGFRYSSPQSTPLPTDHSLLAPPSDESEAAKWVLRNLCSTSGMGLVLGGRGPVVLAGHVDASWVDDLATQWSSQGYTFSLGSGSVSWRSTCSSFVLNSNCEAEIYAGAMAAQELCWLTYLLTDLGERPCSSPILYVDNKAMIALCQEHGLEHIALRYFLARELHQRVVSFDLLIYLPRHFSLVIINISVLF
ncbi:unnamed protein product [Closterium sp. NIES-53]